MNWSTLLNLSGLVVNMAGAFIMYYYSSKVSSSIFIYTDAEMKRHKEKDLFKNRMIRFGMLLLFIGFLVQALAFFVK
jgi:hypothetical protein